MIVEWSTIKSFINQRALSIQYTDLGNKYWLLAFDGPFNMGCFLDKTAPDTTDLDDFETNFKPSGNKKIEPPRDIDGSIINRLKAAKAGWTYHLTAPEFITSTIDSLYHKDVAGADLGQCTVKYYDASNTELITQGSCDTDCVKTVFSFEPPFDYEIIGGTVKTIGAVSVDVRCWVIAVPDIPAAYGGSKVMVQNVNLKFIDPNNGIEADGRASKFMTYSSSLHTNKIQLILKHPVGHKESIMMAFEIYKA